MYEITSHQVERTRVDRALTDIGRRIFSRWHAMRWGDDVSPEAFAGVCDELLDHVAACSLGDPALASAEARKALRTAAECAAAVLDRRLWPNGDFDVDFPVVTLSDGPARLTSPDTSYSMARPQTPPVAEWVRSFALCLISSAFEVPWRRGIVLKLDIAPVIDAALADSAAALAMMDALAGYLVDGDVPPLVVKPDPRARARAALRLDEAGPLTGDERLLRVLLEDDRRAFEEALAARLAEYRDGVGDDPEPRSLLPLTALALANLAVFAHGWPLDVRSGYLPEGLLLEPPADEAPAGTRPVPVPSRHSLPDLDVRLRDADVLEPAEGLRLLERLLEARTGAPDPRLTAPPGDAARLVAMCGGSPDAIEVIAALLAVHPGLPLADARTRLAEAGGSGPVETVVRYAYGRLGDVQQRVLRLMTLDPGPAISTSALAALTALPESRALAAVEALAQARLVEAGEPYGRWRPHALVRAHVSALPAADGDDGALARLLEHYRATAVAADRRLRTGVADRRRRFPGRDDALVWLDTELPNLIAAARTAVDTGHPRVTRDIALALSEYLSLRRRFTDRLDVSALALEAARGAADQPALAAGLNAHGIALRDLRRFEEAIAAHTEAAEISGRTGDRLGEAVALNNRGSALRCTGRSEEAIAAHTGAAGIYREIGDRSREGLALNNLGIALRDVQRFEEAVTVLTEAAEIFGRTGDRRREGLAVNNLGGALQKVRRLDEAIAAHTGATGLFRQAGDRHGEATAWHGLGLALHAAGRPEDAASATGKAAAAYRDAGDDHGHQRTLALLERIRAHQGDGG
ncbi:Imm49 family immunity protein [Actinomadura sp. GTD37]|uniref:Imm49 family immunity protein n=1 Tax=Actinomadura sp. GTD37 TaxID=1778030 RepID=UPI0035C2046A